MFFLKVGSAQRILALSMCSAALLTGCSLFENEPENFDSLESAEADAEHLDQLKSWIFPPTEAETVRRAFVQRCVAEAGGTYIEPERNFELETAIVSGSSREQLREYGYAPVKAEGVSPLAESDQAGQQAYFGSAEKGTVAVNFMETSTGEIPADGCMAQSYQYVYGSVQDGMKAALLAPDFAQAIADEVLDDQKYQELQNSWSSCMAGKGYKGLSTTDGAWDLAQHSEETAKNELAAADADCREEVQFEETAQQIQNDYYEAVYKRVKRFRKELEKIHETALTRVEEDKANPQNSSPITLEEETASAGATEG